MVYPVGKIMRDVRVVLDENQAGDRLIAEKDADTLSLNEIIRSKIEEAARRVETDAPVYLLEEGHDFGDAVYWGEMESGWVLLPDDFMRLIVFEMSDWERAVFTAISPADPEYGLQRQRVKALRGTAQRPVCAIVNRSEGKALEFYSCKSEDAYVRRAQYLPYPRIDRDGGIDICERCYTAVVYAAASLISLTLGEADKSAAFSEVSKTALQ